MNRTATSLRFAYSTINWGVTPDFVATFADIREAGWRAVELFWHDLNWMGPAARMRETLGNLQVATLFGAVRVPTDEAQLVRLRHEVAYAAELGADHYGLTGGDRLRWRPPSPEEERNLARLCETLAVFGAEMGVAVAYHPHAGFTVETEDEVARLLDATQTLRLCFDVSHVALVGEDPLDQIRRYQERLGYIHLKDWTRGKFVEMGEGSLGIDFAAVLRELEAMRFPGWVVVEQSRSDISPLSSATKNASYLRGIGYDPGSIG
ncbi:MAG: sugar phosphate isomerase/epimerase [Thermomicrobiales bacterium]